MSVILKFSPK